MLRKPKMLPITLNTEQYETLYNYFCGAYPTSQGYTVAISNVMVSLVQGVPFVQVIVVNNEEEIVKYQNICLEDIDNYVPFAVIQIGNHKSKYRYNSVTKVWEVFAINGQTGKIEWSPLNNGAWPVVYTKEEAELVLNIYNAMNKR